jgi:hypothetical protein
MAWKVKIPQEKQLPGHQISPYRHSQYGSLSRRLQAQPNPGIAALKSGHSTFLVSRAGSIDQNCGSSH